MLNPQRQDELRSQRLSATVAYTHADAVDLSLSSHLMNGRYAVNIWTVIEIIGDRVSGVHDHVVGIASHLATAPSRAPR